MIKFGVKNIILFDIDYTLINTDVIKVETIENISQYFSTTTEIINIAKNKYIELLSYVNDLNPNDMLDFIGNELHLPVAKLKSIFYDSKIYKKSVYLETPKILEKINRDKYEIGIYSEGWEFFQRHKLETTGLIKYFDEKLIYISRRKRAEEFVISLPECTIIDDTVEVINNLQNFPQITPIWLNRIDKRKHGKVRTIYSLSELINEIN